MKKKFLSLMMATAMVATTSISAFADSTRGGVTYPDAANIISKDTSDATQDVTITGKVVDNQGNMPAASFKVTVPTAANFTVNKSGTLVGTNLSIKNEGSQKIEVYAQDFSSKGNGDITVVEEDTIAKAKERTDRSTVSLKLAGEKGLYAYLAAGNDKSGVYEEAGLVKKAKDGVKLLTLDAASEQAPVTKEIRIQGTAGGRVISSPVSDDFTLTLKIKKGTEVSGGGQGADSAESAQEPGSVQRPGEEHSTGRD